MPVYNGDDDNNDITAGSSTDKLFGFGGDDRLYSGDGEDTIDGGDGNDFVEASDDDDLIFGGAGEDDLRGSRGRDTLIGGLDGDNLNGGHESDVFKYTASEESMRQAGKLDIIYNFNELSYNDKIDLTGLGFKGLGQEEGYLRVTVQGTQTFLESVSEDDPFSILFKYSVGNFERSITLKETDFIGFTDPGTGTGPDLTGSVHDDVLTGTKFADWFQGGDGNDVLDGKEGNNFMEGGNGNDTFYGGVHNDTMMGDAGDDYMSSNLGSDLMIGGAGSDVMLASGYSNTIGDTLDGGEGRDNLISGQSMDLFRFSSLSHSTDAARDKIVKFNYGDDTIDLSGLGFTGIQEGAGLGSILGYTVIGSRIIINDVNSTFSIELTETSQLSDADFIFS